MNCSARADALPVAPAAPDVPVAVALAGLAAKHPVTVMGLLLERVAGVDGV
jgi:hypothetical protein